MKGGRCLTVVLLLVVVAAGCSPAPPARRILVLGLDGLDPEVVSQLVAEGQLPNFARLAREGATGRMYVEEPLLSPIIWTTLATGREPRDHGIGHFTARLAGTSEVVPVTSAMRRVPAVWNLFSDAARKVAVVGWWATWPAEAVYGTIASDHLALHFLANVEQAGASDEGLVSPPEALPEIRRHVRSMATLSRAELERYAAPEGIDLVTPFDFQDGFSHLRWAVAAAETYRNVGLDLWPRERPDLLMVYLEAVDTVSHLFGHLYRRADLAGDLAAEQKIYGRAVEGAYRLADETLGSYLAALDEHTVLIVLSDHGFALGELPDAPRSAHELQRVSERYHRPEAYFGAIGAGVAAGTRLDRVTPLDLTPTLLAIAGLPPARDMPGRVLPQLAREVARIPSYGREERTPTRTEETDGLADRALIEKLTALGYLGSASSNASDANLAFLDLREGRSREAARQFAALLAASPEDGRLEAGLASALAELGRDEEAHRHFARAIELDPLLVVAFHNRGLLLEREGRREEAIADFRTALRYEPSYEPSRRALERLGAALGSWDPATDEERRARDLVAAAGREMRRGNYAAAEGLLNEALRLAPGASAVHQQIANVAYLAGDLERALSATRRALELDPGNARLRANLQSLERKLRERATGRH